MHVATILIRMIPPLSCLKCLQWHSTTWGMLVFSSQVAYEFVTLQHKIPAHNWFKSCQVMLTNMHCCPHTVARATLRSSQLFCNCYFLTCRIVWFWGITKQMLTGVSIVNENFSPSVHKMLPLIFDLGQHFTNFGSKIFNDDLDASHHLFYVRASEENDNNIICSISW